MITVLLILLTLLEQPAESGKRKLGKLIGKEICTMKHSEQTTLTRKNRGEVI